MISIIVTIYNSEKYLKECLDSIKNQTYLDYEVIMVNDGSTDNSRAIAISYTSDHRFVFVDSVHVGFPEAKNVGLSKAKGDYIIFLDSDDIAHPQWLELLHKAIIENEADIAYCEYKKFNNGDLINNSLFNSVSIRDMSSQKMCPLFYSGCRNYMWNKLIKKELYKDIYFEDCPIMSDVQVVYKMFDKASKVFHVCASLINYRQHSESICATICKTDMFPQYRFELMLKVITFIFDKYDISKFICRRALERELFGVRKSIVKDKYQEIYDANKKAIEHILNNGYKCNFVVDLVVPYVNSTEPVWQKTYTDYTGNESYKNNARFDNPDMFEYFLRGVDKFMPWIRKIHLIVSNLEQVPDYINKEKTHIVLHKDIIPKEYLPTFNSSVIEMFIHNIKGLSEHFIYSNDDMYPIDYMDKSDFFTKDGKPKIVFKNNYVKGGMTFFNSLCLNVYKHTAESLGVEYDEKVFLRPEHSMSSMVLSHCKDCFDKMWHFIKEDLKPFRTDKQHTQYMYLLYERFTNNYAFGGPSFIYYDLNGDIEDITNEIKYRGCKIICLNGVSDNDIKEEDLNKIKEELGENAHEEERINNRLRNSRP